MTPETLSAKNFQKLLLLSLPSLLFFSAFPALNFTTFFPAVTSLNLELSLPELWLIFFTLISLSRLADPLYLRAFRLCFPLKTLLASLTLPACACLSLLWTKNLLRGALTVAILFLLWFSILNIITLLKTSPHFRPLLKKSLLIASIFICAFCWLQCFANVFLNKNLLLCLGCTYSAFGFPHPNGFTPEPQFMGNLLLAPALLSLKNLSGKRSRLISVFIISTLFLTFSRGAIYSFLLALPVLLLATKKSLRGLKSLLKIPCIITTAFIISLLTQGLFAQFSPVNTTFYDGIRASISQLTLNKINLPIPDSPPEITANSSTASPESENSPTFSGYVPESTNIRLRLSELALDRWNDDPFSLIFGTSVGSAGASLYEKFPAELGTPKEIVQNEYVSLLLELGVIPYCIIIFLIVKFRHQFRRQFRHNSPFLLAYAFSLLFFSGLPNALHIYLLPFLL